MKIWFAIALSCALSSFSMSTLAQIQKEKEDQFCQNLAGLGQEMLEKMMDETLTLEQALQANQEAFNEHQVEQIYVFMSQMVMNGAQLPKTTTLQQRDKQVTAFYKKYYNMCRYEFINATVDADWD